MKIFSCVCITVFAFFLCHFNSAEALPTMAGLAFPSGDLIQNEELDCYAGIFGGVLFVDFSSSDADRYLDMIDLENLELRTTISTSSADEPIEIFENQVNEQSETDPFFYRVIIQSGKRILGVVKLGEKIDDKPGIVSICE